jgi:hypothetical protein
MSVNGVINTVGEQPSNFAGVWSFPASEYKEHIITVLYFRPNDLVASIL